MTKLIFLTRLLTLFFTIALSTANANPTYGHKGKDDCHPHSGCLSDHDAHEIVNRWIALGEGQTDLIDQTVTDDITVEDESISFLFNLTIPGPYVVGKEAFRSTLEFAKSQVGIRNTNYEPLLILHDCDTISFRWQATAENTGLDPLSTAKAGDPIAYKGIDILEIEKSTKLIKAAISSKDFLLLIYTSGVKICFQKDAPEACSS